MVLRLLDILTESATKSICAVTAARGRGKSAALGLAIAGAVGFNLSSIFVTSPAPDNLKTLFKFVVEGLNAMGLKEHSDFTLVYSTKPDEKGLVLGVQVFRNHRQTVQYIPPTEHQLLVQAELLVIDEAAAIPLPQVQKLMKGKFVDFSCAGIMV